MKLQQTAAAAIQIQKYDNPCKWQECSALDRIRILHFAIVHSVNILIVNIIINYNSHVAKLSIKNR